MTFMHQHFTSPLGMADFCTESQVGYDKTLLYYGYDDYSKSTHGIELLRTNDVSQAAVQRALAMLDKFGDRLEIPSPVYAPAMVGAFPHVPAFVAGQPEDMWAQFPVYNDKVPIRVYVGLTSSWNITDEQLLMRGVTIAAFALAMQNVRPVYLTPYVSCGEHYGDVGSILSWDLTSPFVMSQLIANMSDSLISRHAGIPAMIALNREVRSSSVPHHPYASNVERMTRALDADPDKDIVLLPIISNDPLLRDPIGWIKNQIARYTNQEAAS